MPQTEHTIVHYHAFVEGDIVRLRQDMTHSIITANFWGLGKPWKVTEITSHVDGIMYELTEWTDRSTLNTPVHKEWHFHADSLFLKVTP